MYNTNIKYLYQLLLWIYIVDFTDFTSYDLNLQLKLKTTFILVDVYFYWKQLS